MEDETRGGRWPRGSTKPLPEGWHATKEGSTTILFQDKSQVFYNPVQEFNRDLSILMINTYADIRRKEIEESKSAKRADYQGLKILEALGATGLRSIRYSREIPDLDHVLANDLDRAACEAMARNMEHNGVSPEVMRPNQGDAKKVMHGMNQSYDVVDLDPYGAPTPFLDDAVQAISDGGLLCVTATDMAVLCGKSGEACWAKYNAISLRAKHCHELALRIALGAIERAANRSGRYIVPLVSLSIDFYIRVFVRVYTGAHFVKQSASKHAMVYQCTSCSSFHLQPMGRAKQTGPNNFKYSPSTAVVGTHCDQCDSVYQLGGPAWAAPIHSEEFLTAALEKFHKNEDLFGTAKRINGLLSVASEELDNPLYYELSAVAGNLHIQSPPAAVFKSAIRNAGYEVSISHCCPNSIKTNAPNSVIWDLMRCWEKENPAKNLSLTSPAHKILSKPASIVADWTIRVEERGRKPPRFLPNPTENWGPGTRATGFTRAGTQLLTAKEKQAARQGKGKRSRRPKDKPCRAFAKSGICKNPNCTQPHIAKEVPPPVDTDAVQE